MGLHGAAVDWLLVGVVPGLLIILFWVAKLVVSRWVARMDDLELRLQRQGSLYHEIKSEQMMDRYWRETVGPDFPKPNPDFSSPSMRKEDEPRGGA